MAERCVECGCDMAPWRAAEAENDQGIMNPCRDGKCGECAAHTFPTPIITIPRGHAELISRKEAGDTEPVGS